jgi:hypothetical protein
VSNPERDSEAVFPPKTSAEPKQQPSSVPILKRSLLFGFLYAAAIAVVGGGVAWLSVGPIGALSVVIGAVMAAVFLGITAASILVAIKYDIVAFFAILFGTRDPSSGPALDQHLVAVPGPDCRGYRLVGCGCRGRNEDPNAVHQRPDWIADSTSR